MSTFAWPVESIKLENEIQQVLKRREWTFQANTKINFFRTKYIRIILRILLQNIYSDNSNFNQKLTFTFNAFYEKTRL